MQKFIVGSNSSFKLGEIVESQSHGYGRVLETWIAEDNYAPYLAECEKLEIVDLEVQKYLAFKKMYNAKKEAKKKLEELIFELSRKFYDYGEFEQGKDDYRGGNVIFDDFYEYGRTIVVSKEEQKAWMVYHAGRDVGVLSLKLNDEYTSYITKIKELNSIIEDNS
jgi:hypothetical protein